MRIQSNCLINIPICLRIAVKSIVNIVIGVALYIVGIGSGVFIIIFIVHFCFLSFYKFYSCDTQQVSIRVYWQAGDGCRSMRTRRQPGGGGQPGRGTDTMRGGGEEGGGRVVFGSPGAGRGGAEERRGPLVIRCGSGLPITQ